MNRFATRIVEIPPHKLIIRISHSSTKKSNPSSITKSDYQTIEFDLSNEIIIPEAHISKYIREHSAFNSKCKYSRLGGLAYIFNSNSNSSPENNNANIDQQN